LARAGVGAMTIVDGDVVDITNINRQLPALHSTVGQAKIKIVADRLMDINPALNYTGRGISSQSVPSKSLAKNLIMF
jgi:tRNA A37 threonylcarbamoyladenosine dehydratase